MNLQDRNGKKTTYDHFSVNAIGYDSKGNINHLVIRNDTKKCIAFTMGEEPPKAKGSTKAKEAPQTEAEATIDGTMLQVVQNKLAEAGIGADVILAAYKKKALADLTIKDFKSAVHRLDLTIEAKNRKESA